MSDHSAVKDETEGGAQSINGLRQYCGNPQAIASFVKKAGEVMKLTPSPAPPSAGFNTNGEMLLWLSPDRVWVLYEDNNRTTQLEDVAKGLYQAELAAGYVRLVAEGAENLQKELALDLEIAKGGEVWQTKMARVGVVVVCHYPQTFTLLIPRSYGRWRAATGLSGL